MEKYECTVCGYVYAPGVGKVTNEIDYSAAFEDLPDDWECPVCGAGKYKFALHDDNDGLNAF